MFRRLAVISAVAGLCFIMAGCYSVKVCAPGNTDVSLAQTEKPLGYKTNVRAWYAIWGLVPNINAEDGVQRVIKDNDLTDVRVTTETTVIDWLISYFLGFVTIGSRPIVIEGSTN